MKKKDKKTVKKVVKKPVGKKKKPTGKIKKSVTTTVIRDKGKPAVSAAVTEQNNIQYTYTTRIKDTAMSLPQFFSPFLKKAILEFQTAVLKGTTAEDLEFLRLEYLEQIELNSRGAFEEYSYRIINGEKYKK